MNWSGRSRPVVRLKRNRGESHDGLLAAAIVVATFYFNVRGTEVRLTLLTAGKTQHPTRIDGIDPERTQPYSERSRQSLSDMVRRQHVTAECSKVDRSAATCAA